MKALFLDISLNAECTRCIEQTIAFSCMALLLCISDTAAMDSRVHTVHLVSDYLSLSFFPHNCARWKCRLYGGGRPVSL